MPGAGLIVRASSVGGIGFLPPFATGTLSVLIGADIGIQADSLGLALGAFFLSSGLGAGVFGRLADRRGAGAVMTGGAVLLSVSMLLIAFVASNARDFILLLGIAGVANGAIQPSTHLTLARGVRSESLGIAFGIKSAAIPSATLVAGFLVPAIGVRFGWETAFVGLAVLSVALPFLFPSTVRRQTTTALSAPEKLPTVLLSLTNGLGTASALVLAGFYVPFLVSKGVSVGSAGLLLSLSSVAVVLTRLLLGWLADSWAHVLHRVSMLFIIGAIGYGLFALEFDSTFALIIGSLLAFLGGWGWPGLLFLAVVRANPNAAGAATGYVQVGASIGAFVGTAVFGSIAATTSYQSAWLVPTVLGLVAAVSALLASAALSRVDPA